MTGWRRDVAEFERKIEAGEGKYVPHPATWLNEKRWRDSPPVRTTSTTRANPNTNEAILATRDRMRAAYGHTLHGAPISGPTHLIPEAKEVTR